MTLGIGKLCRLATFGWLLLTSGQILSASAKSTTALPPPPVLLTQDAEGVTVKNISNQQIVQVSLSCFFTKGRMQFAIHGLLNQQLSLDPQTQIKLVDGSTRQAMLEQCRSYYPTYRASIIVKRVIFADKTGWPPPATIPGGWAENLGGTPLKLSTTWSGYIVLNTSERAISEYTLGCIQINGDHIRILRRYPSDQLQSVLESGGSIHVGAIDAPAPDIVQDCVLRRKKKMAVVEVRFHDGSIWQPTTKP